MSLPEFPNVAGGGDAVQGPPPPGCGARRRPPPRATQLLCAAVTATAQARKPPSQANALPDAARQRRVTQLACPLRPDLDLQDGLRRRTGIMADDLVAVASFDNQPLLNIAKCIASA